MSCLFRLLLFGFLTWFSVSCSGFDCLLVGAYNKCSKDAETSDENGKWCKWNSTRALCKLPSKMHPTCGAALLLLITPNSALRIQFNTSATFGKAFYSHSQPKISGEKLIRSLFLLPERLRQTVKMHATEKHRRLPPSSTHTSKRLQNLLRHNTLNCLNKRA